MGCRTIMAESEKYGRVIMAESEYWPNSPNGNRPNGMAEPSWPNPKSMAESLWPNPNSGRIVRIRLGELHVRWRVAGEEETMQDVHGKRNKRLGQ